MGIFIEFRIQIAVEFFKYFDQNFGWKCSCSWLRNSYGILQEFWSEYWWESLVAIRWQQNSYGIHQEFWSECWWETLVANTSDDFGIRLAFWSEFCLEMKLLIFWSEFQSEKDFLKNSAVICFSLYEKLINFREEDVIWILRKIRWIRNSSSILIRILLGNFRGKFIRWIKKSSRISIRILVGNSAAADCGIPIEFWLQFQLHLNGAKSADCV